MRSSSAVRALQETLRPKPKLRRVTKYCTHCDGAHSADTLWCSVCKATARSQAFEWRKEQKRRGLCNTCVEKMDRGSIARCTHHLAVDNAWQQARIAEQRAAGLCAWGRCQEPSELHYCDKHRAVINARGRAARQQSSPARRPVFGRAVAGIRPAR